MNRRAIHSALSDSTAGLQQGASNPARSRAPGDCAARARSIPFPPSQLGREKSKSPGRLQSGALRKSAVLFKSPPTLNRPAGGEEFEWRAERLPLQSGNPLEAFPPIKFPDCRKRWNRTLRRTPASTSTPTYKKRPDAPALKPTAPKRFFNKLFPAESYTFNISTAFSQSSRFPT